MNIIVTFKRLLFTVLLLSTTTDALDYCVTNTAQLEFALADAITVNQSNHIKLAIGIYTVPNGGFVYDGASHNYNLEISGGWRTIVNNPCGQRLTNQFDTIIDGSSDERGLLIRGSSDTRVEISNLTFAFGSATSGKGGGLFIRDANLTLEYCSFIDNTAPLGGAALNVYKGYDHNIRNNVFSHNHSTNFAGAIDIYITDTVLGVYFTNNTVVFNDTTSTSNSVSSGLNITNDNSTKAYVGNNILLYNETNDIGLYGNNSKYLVHNDILFATGIIPINTYGNVNANPSFVDGPTYLYDLNITSPLVDIGIEPDPMFPIFPNGWYPGDTDIGGNPRIQGKTIDIGAFETTPEVPIFINGFE